jgi:hypothetical protein
MRLRRALCWLAFISALAPTSFAQPAPAPAPAKPGTPDPGHEVARRHFRQGVKLYQDANYVGALVEFEAAYAAKPSPGSLQNIALCHKALYRYAEAADALTRLLELHAADLRPNERLAVELLRNEFEARVGSILLQVTPRDARVEFDGKTLPANERAQPMRVNAGQHSITVEAPGYARVSRSVRVAPGSKPLPVEITLAPIAGFLAVRASDPAAAIAIDGRPLALGRYSGPVTPDQEHVVHVYRQGFEPFEQSVRVGLGKTVTVNAKLGAARPGEIPGTPTPDMLPPPPGPARAKGWYGLAAFGLYGTSAEAFDFDHTLAESSALALGARAGRRLWPSTALEGMLEFGQLHTSGACDKRETARRGATCRDSTRVNREYRLRWARVGPTFRLMTSNDHVRLVAGVGTGIVWHGLELDGIDGNSTTHTAGVDPYFLLELGIAVNWQHVLFGLDLTGMVDGARGLDTRSGETAFESSHRTLPWLGLGLRVGYSEWAPSR